MRARPAALAPLPNGLAQFLDGMGETLQHGLVPARIYNDPAVADVELERVFGRGWVYLGHESEIAAPGDYVLRAIGEDPFILVRDEHGTVRVLYDACRHRGTQLCRADRGNVSHFRCPYHGWTYRNTGELVGMPAGQVTADRIDKEQWGLIAAPHVESLHGLVFASLDPEAPPFAEYLGDFRYYLDLFFATFDDLEVIAEPHRSIVDGNWKTGAENFLADDYHVLFLHRSMHELGIMVNKPGKHQLGHHISTGNGHGLSFGVAPVGEEPFWGYPPELHRAASLDRLTPAQADLAVRCTGGGGTLFPNMSFMILQLTGSPKVSEPTSFLTVRVWQPKGPDRFELWSWVLAPASAPQEFRERSYAACMSTFSTAGIFEQDDTEAWRSITRTASSAFSRRQRMPFNFQMGQEIGSVEREPNWPGPGWVSNHSFEETLQRMYYRRWLEFMTEDPYPASWEDPRSAA